MGYVVRTPHGDGLAPIREGAPVTLFIHTAVREDAIDLYGFQTQEELAFFKMLMSISGVGPKTALSILNVADVPSLKRATVAGDATVLTRVYGIGKKSAERMVLELKDKLAHEQIQKGIEPGHTTEGSDADVIEALEALGYSSTESRRALQSLASEHTGIKERLGAALKYLGTPTR